MEQLLRYGVLNHPDFIGEISGTASGEYGLEQLLEKIRKSWSEIGFTTINHRDQSDIWSARLASLARVVACAAAVRF